MILIMLHEFIDDLTKRLLLSVFDVYSDDSEMYFFEPTCSSWWVERKQVISDILLPTTAATN